MPETLRLVGKITPTVPFHRTGPDHKDIYGNRAESIEGEDGVRYYYIPASSDKGWQRRANLHTVNPERNFKEPDDFLWNVSGGTVAEGASKFRFSEVTRIRQNNPIIDVFGAGFSFPARIAVGDITAVEPIPSYKENEVPHRTGTRGDALVDEVHNVENFDADEHARKCEQLKIKDHLDGFLKLKGEKLQKAFEKFFEGREVFEGETQAKDIIKKEILANTPEGIKHQIRQPLSQHEDIPAFTDMTQEISFRDVEPHLFGMWVSAMSRQIMFDPRQGGMRNMARGGCFNRVYSITRWNGSLWVSEGTISFVPYQESIIESEFANACIKAWHAYDKSKIDFTCPKDDKPAKAKAPKKAK